jgi:hypothetical protein
VENPVLRFWLRAFAILTVAAAAFAFWALWYNDREKAAVAALIPTADQVRSIDASVTQVFEPGSERAVPWLDFSIPPEHFSTILRAFTPRAPARETPSSFSSDIARLRITRRDGRVHNIRVAWYGKQPATFFIDDVLCYRDGPYEPVAYDADSDYESYVDESMAIGSLLRAIQKADKARIHRESERLDMSAGRIPNGISKRP